MPFDRNKPYGSVHGLPGVSYEQGGKLYNEPGHLVSEAGVILNDEPAIPLKKKGDAKKPASTDSDEVELVPGVMVPADMVADPEPPDDFIVEVKGEEINLSAYRRGEAHYQWFKLKQAVVQQFGRYAENKDELLEVLESEGITAPESPDD